MIEKIIKKDIASRLSKSWEGIPKEVKFAASNFILGGGLGLLGKTTGQHGIPAVLPAIDLFAAGRISPYIPEYVIGVAMVYLPEIYLVASLISKYN